MRTICSRTVLNKLFRCPAIAIWKCFGNEHKWSYNQFMGQGWWSHNQGPHGRWCNSLFLLPKGTRGSRKWLIESCGPNFVSIMLDCLKASSVLDNWNYSLPWPCQIREGILHLILYRLNSLKPQQSTSKEWHIVLNLSLLDVVSYIMYAFFGTVRNTCWPVLCPETTLQWSKTWTRNQVPVSGAARRAFWLYGVWTNKR
jgi:hypothetical protein